MPMSCLNFTIHWRYTEIRWPEFKLPDKSSMNTQTASGAWNYWSRIASLLKPKEEKSEDEMSSEYGG
jgi:hypothetical protein